MTLLRGNVELRIGNNVRASFNKAWKRWFVTDDGVNWYGLPRNLKRLDTVAKHAAERFGIKAQLN